ncbi:excisionase family DNA binding protein [Algoriphagus iocasae]|uniref:Excisionase family DNA binding protein n=1 Tax=Algoriphagus iocasae TaxID=1836499 RepID=A0A841MNL2_9BACT|nr:DUF3853 family protein [Algoriphagus iocasae]MBB6327109.1 excisionase family DNA binding protein [Algoriphagus iocasae]
MRTSEKPLQKGNTLKGMKALAELLGCSLPTAHKLKASGKIPYYQHNRLIIFDRAEVLKALEMGGQNG